MDILGFGLIWAFAGMVVMGRGFILLQGCVLSYLASTITVGSSKLFSFPQELKIVTSNPEIFSLALRIYEFITVGSSFFSSRIINCND